MSERKRKNECRIVAEFVATIKLADLGLSGVLLGISHNILLCLIAQLLGGGPLWHSLQIVRLMAPGMRRIAWRASVMLGQPQ